MRAVGVDVGKRTASKIAVICVLGRGQEWTPPEVPGKRCTDRSHGHCNERAAEVLASQGLADWVYTERATAKGKALPPRRENAIQLVAKRRWKAKMSGTGGARVKVMQLVA
jgi:hypothetical protein